MNVWIALILMAVAALIGVAAGRWNGRNALDAEYDAGYEDGLVRATEDLTAQLDAQDHAYLRTQELDVPRPGEVRPPVLNGTASSLEPSAKIEAGPGHHHEPEWEPAPGDAIIRHAGHHYTPPAQPTQPADFLSRLSDDEFWRVAPLWLAAARGLADAPWRPFPAWSAPMLERAA